MLLLLALFRLLLYLYRYNCFYFCYFYHYHYYCHYYYFIFNYYSHYYYISIIIIIISISAIIAMIMIALIPSLSPLLYHYFVTFYSHLISFSVSVDSMILLYSTFLQTYLFGIEMLNWMIGNKYLITIKLYKKYFRKRRLFPWIS